MERNLAQTSSAAASRARHRAPEPHDVDELTDTVAISPLCLAYGQHAARTAGLPELWPATRPRAVPIGHDAPVAKLDADAGAPDQPTAAGRLVHLLAGRLRRWQRSA